MNELCDKQYLDAVVYEVCGSHCIGSLPPSTVRNHTDSILCCSKMLRLFPAAPLALPHTCVEDHSIGEYTITKGTVVVANIFALHRDPLLWTDPELFRPERFLEDDTLRKSANFIPFGVGPRVCIGKQLGIVGMKKVIAGLLQNFVVYAPGTSCVIRIKEGTQPLFSFICCVTYTTPHNVTCCWSNRNGLDIICVSICCFIATSPCCRTVNR
jgi:hypothetical protein